MNAESTTEIEASIYDLYKKVSEHPEFAGGTIWTRYDVADALFVPEDETPTPEQVASVTDEMRWDAEEVIRSFIFDTNIMEWRELLRESMDIPEAMRDAYAAARPR